MPGPVWYDGEWCDVATHPDGYAFAYLANGNTDMVAVANGVEVWTRALGQACLSLRIACDPVSGEVRGIVTGSDDKAHLVEASGTTDLGTAFGQRATVLKYESGDWVAYICRTGTTYTRWPLSGADPGAIANPFTSGGSSQGIVDVVAGVPVWANIAEAGVATDFYTQTIAGVLFRFPSSAGGVTVGQSFGGGSHPDALYAYHDSLITRVIGVLSFEPHVAAFGDGSGSVAIASRTVDVNGLNAALVIAPTWVGATVGAGGTMAGSNVARGTRKTGSPLVPIAGGNLPGVTVTDPAGRLTVLPFRSSGTGFLREDGRFAAVDLAGLLDALSAVRGSILYRGAAAWLALAPGTAGQVLETQGAGADPQWSAASSLTAFAPLSAGGEPLELISDGDGRVVMVPWSPE